MVNLLVCGSTLAIPKPFGPRNPTDVFKNDVETKLDVLATDFDVYFIDDWNKYHCYYGEIHCGTNVKRTPPAINWWE